MGHAMDGLRHLIHGGTLDVLTRDIPVLLAWLAAALLLAARTACTARKATRLDPRPSRTRTCPDVDASGGRRSLLSACRAHGDRTRTNKQTSNPASETSVSSC
jgi:hypothetical protein